MIRRFLYLNGLATVCLVIFHATGMGFVAMITWLDRYSPGALPSQQIGTLSYYGLRFLEQIVVFTIPAFLIVSGYFISFATGKNQTTISWRVVWSRVVYLVIPYLVWSAIILGLRFVEGRTYSLGRILIMLLFGRMNEIYYYVPLLIQLYLISPFLVLWAKRNWQSLLLVTGIIHILIGLLNYPEFLGSATPISTFLGMLFPKWLFLTRVFWFSLGIVLGNHLSEFKQTFYPYRWVLLGGAVVLIVVGMVEWEFYFKLSGLDWLPYRETLIDYIYGLVVILGILAFEKAKFPFFDALSWLGSKTFGVFLIHAIVIEYVARLIYRFTPQVLAYQILLQPILIIFGLGIPLLLMAIVDKSPARRFYSYLFG